MENPPLRILMVEDSEEDALLLLRQLRRKNVNLQSRRVDNAETMKQALQTEIYDVVLSDHNLPRFDSFGALNVLQETGQDLPFIVVSASIGEQTAVELMRCGAHDFVMKDHTARLAPAIHRELREAQNRRERRDALASLHHRNQELETLNQRLQSMIQSSKKIAACPDIGSMGKAALREFATLMAAEGGSLFIKETEHLVLAFSLDPDHVPGGLAFPLRPDSVLGRVWNGKAPLVITDIEKQSELARSGWSGYQNGSLLAFPLLDTQGEMLGIVALHNKIDRPFAAQDREIGMILGSLFCETRRALAAAENLRQSEEAFRALAENSIDTIMRFDRKYRYLYVNPAVEKLTDIPPADFIGKTHAELGFPQDICQLCEEAIQKVFRGNGINRLEFRLPNGMWIDWLLMPEFDEQGRVRSVLAASRDISERRQMEEDRLRLTTAIEQAGEIFIITDTTGTINYVNPAFVKITGYSHQEVLGNNPRILKSGKHGAAFYRQLWSTISSGHTWRGRLHNRRKDGSLFVEDATISPVRNQAGEIIHYIGVKRDITHEVELENQLRQAQKMEAIGQLAGGIAHDFNNILGGIIGYTQLALMSEAQTPDNKNHLYLSRVLEASNRAKELVQQILRFSRKEENVMGVLPLAPLIKESAKLLRATLPTTITIDQRITARPDIINGDPTQIHQVVMNLCTNAYHAMRETGGILTISLRNITLESTRKAMALEVPPGEYLKLTIQDTGCGITPRVLERIFDPYFTTKKINEGTGLGLSVTLGIVRNHNGLIEVKSRINEGTRFDIHFPLVSQAAVEKPAPAGELPRGKGQRVLVVDDEPFFLEVAREHLEHLGYQVSTCQSSLKALETLNQAPGQVDLLVTDQTMPEMTGVQLIAEIRKTGAMLPVCLCTGYSETVTEQSARHYGIDRFLMKPVTMADLARAVHETLGGAGKKGNR